MSNNIHDTKTDLIKKEVYDLLNDISKVEYLSESYKSNLEQKYKYLHTTSKTLFNFVLKQKNITFDKASFDKNLDMMLCSISLIQSSKVSQYDASAKISESLAHEFIPNYSKMAKKR